MKVANSSPTVPSHQKTGPNLFSDGDVAPAPEPENEDIDLDVGFGDVDEDWIIDGLGGALKDAPATTSGKAKDGFVKEMGEILSFVFGDAGLTGLRSALPKLSRPSSPDRWRAGRDILVCTGLDVHS